MQLRLRDFLCANTSTRLTKIEWLNGGALNNIILYFYIVFFNFTY